MGVLEVGETAVAIKEEDKETAKKLINVGLIMPIAEIAGLNEQHWEDVKRIIIESLKDDNKYDMNIRLVSHSDEVRVIQTSIVQNIYNDDIVIIDVSAKNANVMFEFGMRLAFDKAFVVIKDDATPYIFDTGNIQHLEYPRDLRYTHIENFKINLKNKVIKTLEHSLQNNDKSLYLEQYGDLKPSKIEGKEVDITEYFERALGTLRKDFKRLEGRVIKEDFDTKDINYYKSQKLKPYKLDEFNNDLKFMIDRYFKSNGISIDKMSYTNSLLNYIRENLLGKDIVFSEYELEKIVKVLVKEVIEDNLPF